MGDLLRDLAATHRPMFTAAGASLQVDAGSGATTADADGVRRLVEGLFAFAARRERSASRVVLTGWPTRRAYLVQLLIEGAPLPTQSIVAALAGERDADAELANLAAAAVQQGGGIRLLFETPSLCLEVALPKATTRSRTPQPRNG